MLRVETKQRSTCRAVSIGQNNGNGLYIWQSVILYLITRLRSCPISESNGISREDSDSSYTETEAAIETAVLHSVDALSSFVFGGRLGDLGESTGGA